MADVAKRPLGTPAETGDNIWARRNFLALAGWGAVLSFLGIATLGWVRYMFPRVLFEPPSTFKAGYPTDYVVGEVSNKYKASKRVWIVRTEEGFYALLAICTHLGCTPRWLAGENKFKCPCHGSGFTKEGINFEGPAPRPLERVKITLSDDGQLLVDKSVKYRQELGQWHDPGAFLEYSATA